jgi:hypothetical protein
VEVRAPFPKSPISKYTEPDEEVGGVIQFKIFRDFIIAITSILWLKIHVRLKMSSKLAPLISIIVPPPICPDDGNILLTEGLGRRDIEVCTSMKSSPLAEM